VEKEAVITAKDVESIYEVPLVFHREGLDDRIVEKLNIWTRAPRLEAWQALNDRIAALCVPVRIGIVGTYINLKESYKSLNEALYHGGIHNDCRVILDFIDSEELETEEPGELLAPVDGILVPGGFGARGVAGKVRAIQFARENQIPYFGICLGMQLAVVEFARHLAGLTDAHSTEFSPATPYPVVYLMREWFDYKDGVLRRRDESSDKGGTMRLGAYPCRLQPDTRAFQAYRQEEISERHRHRYELNLDYKERLEEKGLVFSGLSPDGVLAEIVELRDHPWFLGCQFHPEFKSRPMDPHPLFREFIRAALERSRETKAAEHP
jgi:CTP synthase